MRFARFVSLVVAGCSAPASHTSDAAEAPPPDLTPRDLPDDTEPYALPATCAELTTWSLEPAGLNRVAAVSSREAWVIQSSTSHWPGRLLHLLPDGTFEVAPFQLVTDTWRCPGEMWAVTDGGVIARKRDGLEWDVFTFSGQPFRDGGVGCGDHVWVGQKLFDGVTWHHIANFAAVRVRGAGRWRVATEFYGETAVYDPVQREFIPVFSEDNLITDAVVFRDGTGATLYDGFAMKFLPTGENIRTESPLHGERVVRRSDTDLWMAGSFAVQTTPTWIYAVRHFDGAQVVDEPLPAGHYAWDIDARADAVWSVGGGGAAVRTQAGWCEVLRAP